MLKKNKNRFRTDLRTPLVVCAIVGTLLLAMMAVLTYFSRTEWVRTEDLTAYAIALTLIELIFCGSIVAAYLVRYRKITHANDAAEEMTTEISDLFRYVVDLPYAIINAQGQVRILSGALQELLESRSPVCNIPLESFCPVPIERIVAYAQNGGLVKKTEVSEDGVPHEITEQMTAEIKGRKYNLRSYILRSRGVDYYFVVFDDVTERLKIQKQKQDDSAVVAYVVIDSLQELAQYVRVNYLDAVSEIETILKRWVTGMGGMMREYEREKYLLMFDHAALDRCISQKFRILDAVRNLKLGDHSFPVTVSIGIGAVEGSFEDKERAASDALDVALQRGGDQVAVNDGKNIVPYGGRTNSNYGSTSITSRVNSEYLCELIQNAGNVLIMGHRSPDYDSIGSCVGLARLAISARNGDASKVRIVINRDHPNFRKCYDILSPLPEYRSMFISGDTGLDCARSDTLLILSDVSNVFNTEAPKLIKCVRNIVIIDHHRRPDQLYEFKPLMTYIRPSVAAASELVSAMLEYSPYQNALLKEEATLMLAGLMLDTKNFTTGAEMQTFSAVRYLYSKGAHTNTTRGLFSESMENLFTACDINSRTRTYRDKVAITWLSVDHPATEADRLAIAKAADNLMTLDGIEASFALLHADNNVSISARSHDQINVQLIMQDLGGGGHYDMAAATLTHTSLDEACNQLKAAIDHYMDYSYESEKA